MIDKIQLPTDFSLRIAGDADEQFLAELFYTTRHDLRLLPLPHEQLALLLQQQYTMQTKSYALQYPHAYKLIIEIKGQAIGKLILDLNETRLHLVDFIIVESQRNKGYGSLLLTALQDYVRAKKLSLHLSVDRHNSAAQNYMLAADLCRTNHRPLNFGCYGSQVEIISCHCLYVLRKIHLLF